MPSPTNKPRPLPPSTPSPVQTPPAFPSEELARELAHLTVAIREASVLQARATLAAGILSRNSSRTPASIASEVDSLLGVL